ncbi:MAG: 2OG-Fe(II) oxygenase, partial [Alphaproteobacteria bacterium]
LDFMDEVRLGLNCRLFLGLFEFEACFSVYPPGAHYQRHLDSFRGAANRLVSAVTYLNDDWSRSDGGLLRLFDDEGRVVAEVTPEAGTLALFLSEEVPHEVTETRRVRKSIAGWFRVNASVGDVLDPPR